ncbi:hypothetical protein M422DRAFT_84708, partial [Sphaerobolus stellatus SS14]
PSCACPSSGNQRSVWDIVWSCATTTFAVTWVSVHPNIPSPGEEWWWVRWRRIKAMFWTLVSPDVMVVWAWHQYTGAKTITKEISQLKTRYQILQGYIWTQTHSHYLQMGGFVLQGANRGIPRSSAAEPAYLTNAVDLPLLSADEIMDRSKNDPLGKAVASVQIFWFVTQVIARGVEKQAITELELTTVALAVLNISMYLCWWNKPMDIQFPTTLQLRQITLEINAVVQTAEPAQTAEPIQPYGIEELEDTIGVKNNQQVSVVEAEVETANWLAPVKDIGGAIKSAVKGSIAEDGCFMTILSILFFWTIIFPLDEVLHGVEEGIPKDRLPIFFRYKDDDVPGLTVFIILSAGLAFGSIHLIGWSFTFPSETEKILWRTAGCIVTGFPMLLLLIGIPMVHDTYHGFSERATRIVRSISFIFISLMVILYVPARFYLLIEGIIALRKLPASAFDSIDWVSTIHHL